MTKSDQLLLLKSEAETADLPYKDSAHNLVFGAGDPNARIYLLGEAPGKNEDLTGQPFCGASGKLLDKMLALAGLVRQQVFITSLLWYRPTNNADPTPEQIQANSQFLDTQIKIISPQIIISLGRFSLQKFLPNARISEVHGQVFDLQFQSLNIKFIPMYHPAAAFHSNVVRAALVADFTNLTNL